MVEGPGVKMESGFGTLLGSETTGLLGGSNILGGPYAGDFERPGMVIR